MRSLQASGVWLACVLFVVSFHAAHAQDSERVLVVEIRQADGTRRGTRGLLQDRPADLLGNPRVNIQFLQRPDVKDEAGRIVTGVGLTAWAEGDGARVWVFSIVPKEGVPNEYYGTPQGMTNTRREPLVELSMKPGDVRRLDEMQAWGFDPFVLELVVRDR